ncbi:MAG: porin family protein [Rikenellaceae bacterium]|jgi:outer membrane protein X|nr:porin family protein [Rikenellaceae bacterium]
MKNIFKVAIIAIALTMTAVTTNAQQKGNMAVGANVALGMGNNLTNFGLGAKLQYNVLDLLRLDGSFTYYLPKKDDSGMVKTSMWDFSVNAHWLFPVTEKSTVYPLVGFGILGTKVDMDMDGTGSSFGGINIGGIDIGGIMDMIGGMTNKMSGAGTPTSNTSFGVNLGGGMDFRISESLLLNLEAKYKIVSGGGRFIVSAGVAYLF